MLHNNSNILDGRESASIEFAIEALRRDELVAIPSETVYGLAARATSPTAIKKIFELKGRPPSHPLILHIAKSSDLDKWSLNLPLVAKVLTEQYWPGPLTIVVERNANVSDEITGGRDTVAIRCPDHKITTDLLMRLDDAIVAPSANRFGKVSPTSAEHVFADLGHDVEIILDGGECSIGLESTIIDCTTTPPQLLRAGAITVEQIETECEVLVVSATGESRASGMLDTHYAPECRIEIFDNRMQAENRQLELSQLGTTSEILDFGDDLTLYAHSLYARLRDADQRNIDVVIAVKPPFAGIGVAINERLKKAANPR